MAYIDREKLIDVLRNNFRPPIFTASFLDLFSRYVEHEIMRQPTADVVEVVRCKDCKYCFDAIMGGMWCEHPDNIMPLGSNPDDFCSEGKRKDK